MLRLFKPRLNEAGERLVDRLQAADLGRLIGTRTGEDDRAIYVGTWCEAEIFRKSSPSNTLRWLRKGAVVDSLTNDPALTVAAYNKRYGEVRRYIKGIVTHRLAASPTDYTLDVRNESSRVVEAFVMGVLVREFKLDAVRSVSDLELEQYLSGHLVVGWHGEPRNSLDDMVENGKLVVF